MPIFSDSGPDPFIRTVNALSLEISERRTLIKFVLGEARRGRDAIGFIPKPRLSFEASRGHLYALRGSDEYLGFLLRGPWRTITHIHQVWMRQDVRRRLYASLLLAEVLADAPTDKTRTITLNCANDLDAMLFWPSLGFEPVHVRLPTNYRRRRVTTFERTIDADDSYGSIYGLRRLADEA